MTRKSFGRRAPHSAGYEQTLPAASQGASTFASAVPVTRLGLGAHAISIDVEPMRVDRAPHAFRRSSISRMRAAGIEPAELAAMSGDTVDTATKHYTHAVGRSFDAAHRAVGGSS
jgi:hypothetical protein